MSKRLEMLEKMIEKGSSDPFHHYARALELRSLERNAEALEALEGVRESFPAYVPTYLIAAQLALELQQPEAAKTWLTQGTEKAKADGDEHALSEITSLLESL